MEATRNAAAEAAENVAEATGQAAGAARKVAMATENGIMFDAIAAMRKLTGAGMHQRQAECIAGLVQDAYRVVRHIVVDELDRRQFATRDELSAFRTEMSDKLTAFQSEMSDKLAAIEVDLAAMQNRLLLWMGGGLATVVFIILGALGVFT